jgi:hypothetical protein
MIKPFALSLLLTALSLTSAIGQTLRPLERPDILPAAAWDHKANGLAWTQAALTALNTHSRNLIQTVLRDISSWCPAYRGASRQQRSFFWVGLLSALAKHESTWREAAVGSGKWYGLLQIQPSTARGYGCKARSGAALQHGADNVSCAIRIWSQTVSRDQVIADGGGVAADWVL